MNETIKLILEKNPGLFNILLTAVILPIAILLLTNWHTRRMKLIEKKLELNFKSKDDLREQEKAVYSSLSKILFDVQQLHVSLSGTCVDRKCIADALKRFDSSVSKCHEEISSNMLYLSSDSINLIYGFYNLIGELKIQLQELDKRQEYTMANVVVFYQSGLLAEIVINIQELFISQRSELKIHFDKTKQEMMKYCCGREPPVALKEKYQDLKEAMQKEHII